MLPGYGDLSHLALETEPDLDELRARLGKIVTGPARVRAGRLGDILEASVMGCRPGGEDFG
ncbi:MAG: hypothetical protein C5B58_10975 [Acidobacteria bacterium]|nr:MAG: hypothetical protein C5B58_10975 [Acidobacteriota bacterium]